MRPSSRYAPRAAQWRARCCTALFIIAVAAAIPAQGRTPAPLPRSTPEAEGVSSRALLSFIEAMDTSGMEFHSVMVLRHGKVVAEGWWNPYRPDLKHTMYSVSKSFTSTAVGFAVSERRLSVDDKVISFFPDELPDTVSANLAALRVRDLLSMSVGQLPEPINAVRTTQTDWVRSFLATPIVNAPGTKFLYNSVGSYMLSAIVQKVTGQKEIDYLRPRLFEPLGITDVDWEVDPHGINTGGWGLRVRTEAMAKLGLLYLQDGMWNGKQLLPKEWVREATTMKILQSPDMPQEQRDSSDWQQGYCFQFWRCRHNAFRGDGAFGQLIVALPDQDAVLAVTAETSDMQAELNLVWKHLLPAFNGGKLPADAKNARALTAKLASLSLPLPKPSALAKAPAGIAGRTYEIGPNAQGIRSVRFAFDRTRATMTVATDSGTYPLSFSEGTWREGTTLKPGPDLINAKGNFKGLPPFRTRGAYRWADERTLELTLRYIESPHTQTFTCAFDGSAFSIAVRNSLDHGKNVVMLKGTAKD